MLSGNFIRSVNAKPINRNLTKPRTGGRYAPKITKPARKTLTQPRQGGRKLPNTTKPARSPRI